MNIYKVVIDDGKKENESKLDACVKEYNKTALQSKLDNGLVDKIKKCIDEVNPKEETLTKYVMKNISAFNDVIFSSQLNELKNFTAFVDRKLTKSDEVRNLIDDLYYTLSKGIYSQKTINWMSRYNKLEKGDKIDKVLNGDINSDDVNVSVPLMDRLTAQTIRIYGVYADRFIKDSTGKVTGFERNVPIVSTSLEMKRDIEKVLASEGISVNPAGRQTIDVNSPELSTDEYGHPMESNNVAYNILFAEPARNEFAPVDANALLDIIIIHPIEDQGDDASDKGSSLAHHNNQASTAAGVIVRKLTQGLKDAFASEMNGKDKSIYNIHVDMRQIEYNVEHAKNIVKEDGFHTENYDIRDKSFSVKKSFESDGYNEDDDPYGINPPKQPDLLELQAKFIVCYDENQYQELKSAINMIADGLGNAMDYYAHDGVGMNDESGKYDSDSDMNKRARKLNYPALIKLKNWNKISATHDNTSFVANEHKKNQAVNPGKVRCCMISLTKFSGEVLFAESKDELPAETTLPALMKKYVLNSNRAWSVYNSLDKANSALEKEMKKEDIPGIEPFKYNEFGFSGSDADKMSYKDKTKQELDERLSEWTKESFDPTADNVNSPHVHLIGGNATMAEKYGFNWAFVVTGNYTDDKAELSDKAKAKAIRDAVNKASGEAIPKNIVAHMQYISDQEENWGYDEIVVISFNYHVKENYKGKKDYITWLNEIKDNFMSALRASDPTCEFSSSELMTYDKVDGYVTNLITPAFKETFDEWAKQIAAPNTEPEQESKPESTHTAEAELENKSNPKQNAAATKTLAKSYVITVGVNDPDDSYHEYINEALHQYIDSVSPDYKITMEKWNDVQTVGQFVIEPKNDSANIDLNKININDARAALCAKFMDLIGEDDGVDAFITKVDVKEK